MVHKKLMQARVELQAMPLKKSGHNKFAGYNYLSHHYANRRIEDPTQRHERDPVARLWLFNATADSVGFQSKGINGL